MALIDFSGRSYKNLMAKVYGIGASVVLIGALFKINHYPYADLALIVGLGTEATVFFLSSFEPPHVEPDWSLVYPELSDMYHPIDGEGKKGKKETISSSRELDDMLQKADIGQDTIDRLGAGLEKLSETTAKISDVADASLATQEFSSRMKTAARSAENLGQAIDENVQATGNYSQKMGVVSENANLLNSAYTQAAEILKSNMNSADEFAGTVKEATKSARSMAESYQKSAEILSKSVESLDFTVLEGDSYNTQLRKIAENLAALNAIYEIQTRNANQATVNEDKLKSTMDGFYESLGKTASSNNVLVQQMETLTKRIEGLNKVYGNMLTAMNAQSS